MPVDSLGRPIKIGDRVRFETKYYTIKSFIPGGGLLSSDAIEFVQKCDYVLNPPDELNVDLVSGRGK